MPGIVDAEDMVPAVAMCCIAAPLHGGEGFQPLFMNHLRHKVPPVMFCPRLRGIATRKRRARRTIYPFGYILGLRLQGPLPGLSFIHAGWFNPRLELPAQH